MSYPDRINQSMNTSPYGASPGTSRPFQGLRRSSSFMADTTTLQHLGSLRDIPSTSNIRSSAVVEESYSADNSPALTSFPENSLTDSPLPTLTVLTPSTTQGILTFIKSRKFKNVLKCSIAYLLASLVVYTPLGNIIYGHSDNKHMVCTISVYFHPARNSGSMIEAIIFAFIALTFSFVSAVGSMLVSSFFYVHGLRGWGYLIDLVFFCGGSLGLISFTKQKVNKPTFNTACSLASTFLVTILTKEGNVQNGTLSFTKLAQNFLFVCSGTLISFALCYLLWPQSAVEELKSEFNTSMEIYSKLMVLLCDKFLNGQHIETDEYKELSTKLISSFNALDQYVNDVGYYLRFKGQEREYELLTELVESNHRLSLHLNGLASSAQTQWRLLNFNEFTIPMSHDMVQTDNKKLATLFETFVGTLGPPMRTYVAYISQVLEGLPFSKEPHFGISLDRIKKQNLPVQSGVYSRARELALNGVYSRSGFKEKRSFEDSADEEGVAAICGNFSYMLEEIGIELNVFLDVLHSYDQLLSYPVRRSYNWLNIWRHSQSSISAKSRNAKFTLSEFYSNGDHTVDHEEEAQSSPFSRQIGYKFWILTRALRRKDVQFGIKVGIGAILFALPAFIDSLRPIFARWRGEWGLITYCIVMNVSMGGTTMTVSIRFLGTFLGAFLGYLSWTIFPGIPQALAFIGWLVSLCCFWIILHWKSKNPFGRFILLTFNLTVLYSYSLSVADDDNDDDEGGLNPIVGEIAFHRFVSVMVGVLWALFISAVIFPSSARRLLKDTLSSQWLRMGTLWKLDPLRINYGSQMPREEPRFAGIEGENDLQRTMLATRLLLTHASNEWRLKGMFPKSTYQGMLDSTQTILDAFHSINVLILRYPNPSSREKELAAYTLSERKELCSRIFLFFYLASSSLTMGFPLPDKLPSTEHALDRMLAKLNDYRNDTITQDANASVDDEDFVLFYSYVLCTITITEELSNIAMELQHLFGNLDSLIPA